MTAIIIQLLHHAIWYLNEYLRHHSDGGYPNPKFRFPSTGNR